MVAALSGFGQLGVQLFFLVSGFALTLAWSNRREWSPAVTRSFFVRRWFRIAPAYYTAVVGYFLVRLALRYYGPQTHGVTPLDMYRPTVVVANLIFANGFWASAQNSIVPGGWSIAAEFFFYLLFPIIVTRSFPALIVCALAIPAAVAAAALRYHSIGVAPINDSFLYFYPVIHLPCFVSGIILQKNLGAINRGNSYVALGILGLCGAAAVALMWQSGFGGNLSFLLVPGLAAFPFAWLLVASSRSWLGDSAPLRSIGERSFSMYLNHFFFVNVMSLLAGQKPQSTSAVLIGLVVIIAVSYAAAFLTYKYIELPFVAIGRRLTRGAAAARTQAEPARG